MAAAAGSCALSSSDWLPFELKEVEKYNHDSSVFTFGLAAGQALNMPVASCLGVRATIDGAQVIRPYTPISPPDLEGSFKLLIKVYELGVMSKHVHSLEVGDSLDFKGPWPKVAITPNKYKKLGMVAGGTGITPMLQVLEQMLRFPDDTTEITMLYANNSPDDILLKEKIDAWAAEHERFTVHYSLPAPVDGWEGLTGFYTAAVVQKYLPAPEDGNAIFLCGPPPMYRAICGDKNPDKTQGPVTGVLGGLKYTSDQVFKF